MEKRIGVVAIFIHSKEKAKMLNSVLSESHDMILARQGMPLRDRTDELHVISLIIEGTTDQIGALTGKLGRIEGIQVKSVLSKGEPDARPNENFY